MFTIEISDSESDVEFDEPSNGNAAKRTQEKVDIPKNKMKIINSVQTVPSKEKKIDDILKVSSKNINISLNFNFYFQLVRLGYDLDFAATVVRAQNNNNAKMGDKAPPPLPKTKEQEEKEKDQAAIMKVSSKNQKNINIGLN